MAPRKRQNVVEANIVESNDTSSENEEAPVVVKKRNIDRE